MKLRKTLKLLYWLLFEDGIRETLDNIRIYKEVMYEAKNDMYGARIGVQENFNRISYIQDQLNMEQNVVGPKVVDFVMKKIDRDKEDRITDSKLIRDSIIDVRNTHSKKQEKINEDMTIVKQFLTKDDKRLDALEEKLEALEKLVGTLSSVDVLEIKEKSFDIPQSPTPNKFL